MIKLQTTKPRLSIRVYPEREIIKINPPNERFVVVSIANPGTVPANLANLGTVPVLRLKFSIDAPGQGLTREQATEFWQFIQSHLAGLETVLLHCSAGMMRSPALALAISHAFLGGEFPVDADIEPSMKTYLAAVAAYPKIFGRPFPEVRLNELEEHRGKSSEAAGAGEEWKAGKT